MNTDKLIAGFLDLIVLGMFGAVLYSILTKAIPEGARDVALVMLGALTNGFAAVDKYWHGGTASGARKDDTIARQSEMLAASNPPPAA